MSSTNKTKSGRVVKAPKRFTDMKFVAGSGFSGCDHYDMSYDRGNFSGSYKDSFQASEDAQYTKDLEKAMMVKETTQNIPVELAREISKFLTGRSNYHSDINFIAPDNVEPVRFHDDEEEEEEWDSADETSEDEEEWCESDDE